MPVSCANIPGYVSSASIVYRFLNDQKALVKQLNESVDSVFIENDLEFLKKFLLRHDFKNLVKFIDLSTSLSSNSVPTYQPLITQLRPINQEHGSLLTQFGEVWNDIESLIDQQLPLNDPDSEELYEILGEDHIQALLLAADDIANLRFTAYINSDSVKSPVYIESLTNRPVALPRRSETCLNSPNLRLSRPPSTDSSSTTYSQFTQNFRNADFPRGANQLQSSVYSSPSNNLNSGISFDPRAQNYSSNDSSQFLEVLPSRHKLNQKYILHNPTTLNHQPLNFSAEETSLVYSNYQPSNRPIDSQSHNNIMDETSKRQSQYIGDSKTPVIESENKIVPLPGTERIATIRRQVPGEPLGVTLACRTPSPKRNRHISSVPSFRHANHSNGDSVLKTNSSCVFIQRIMVGTLAERDNQLYRGDVLLEINGVPVSSLDDVQKIMHDSASKTELQLLVRTPNLSSLKSQISTRKNNSHKVFIRCLFTYDPSQDSLLPIGCSGLAFHSGEVLELVDSQDVNWWQVRHLDNPNGKTSLVPSRTLEERRQAFNQQITTMERSKKPRKIKSLFRAADSSNLLVRSDIWIYEEVLPWPPSPVQTLLLIGTNGVGRRTLKFLLCTQFPNKFAFPISDTTDSSASRNLFRIQSKEQMESEIRQGAFLEWGTIDGHHYGIRFDALREIIATGRTVIVDCQVQSVYLLHQPEFNPRVVFISAPTLQEAKTMMDRGVREKKTTNKRTETELQEIVNESKLFSVRNQHLYTQTVVNRDVPEAIGKILRLVEKMEKEPDWIPAGWAYEMSLPKTTGNVGKFVPGSSSLSKLGIQGLPMTGRSNSCNPNGSLLSSRDSAARLARPPSICSALQLPTPIEGSRRLYEKRGHRNKEFQPVGPTIIEQSPHSSANNNPSVPNENMVVQQPAKEQATIRAVDRHQKYETRLISKNKTGSQFNQHQSIDADDVSSTSSED